MRSVELGRCFSGVALVAMTLVVGCVEAKQYTPPPPSVPNLRLPQNGAYEGSVVTGALRVQFAWEEATSNAGAVMYELQYSADSSFALDVVTAQTNAVNHLTESTLPVSVLPPVGRRYYWRVRACSQLCSEYSQTWAVNVGRSSKDFNGDGYSDVVLGTPSSDEQGIDAGRAYVYFGGPGNMDIVADGVLSNGSAGDRFGYAVSSAGDFNDDGFADVLVGAPFANVGRAFVYFGGSGATFDAVPDVILSEGAAGDAFGLSVAGLGDLNGDGFSEIAVGAPWRDIGRAYLYSGGRGGQLDVADGILTGGAIGSQFAAHVTSGGDVNADGLADLIINEYLADEGFFRRCSSHVYLGTSGKDLSSLQEHVLVGDVVDSCLMRLAGAHDVDLDGASDLLAIVNTSGKGRVMLFKGGPTFEETPDAVVLMDNHGMFSISVAGDVNGDTLQDVLIIEQYTTTQSSIYLGARNDTGYIIPSRSTGLLNAGGGTSVGAGDLNGDGIPEVITASGGVARIYMGSKTGFDTLVDAVLDHTASGSSVSVALSSSGITAQ